VVVAQKQLSDGEQIAQPFSRIRGGAKMGRERRRIHV
jgi:hypothetical protein